MSRKINFHFAKNRESQHGYEFFFNSKFCPNYFSNHQRSHPKSAQGFSETCSLQLPSFKKILFVLCSHYLYILNFNFQNFLFALNIK
jgi:hypothetical protein